MALFGKNKEEDYEEDPSEVEELENGGNFSKRKFRDLAPKNKKKRKEPPKPWGKKERLIVLFVLLVTVVISAILAFGSQGKGISKLTFPKIDLNALNFFKQETIIVSKK